MEEIQAPKLTLRQKLARIRVEFSEMNIKKSGVNKYGGFNYFELSDITPNALKLFLKYDVTLDFEMDEHKVTGSLYNNVGDDAPITFSFPKRDVKDPKAMRMNEIQAVGSEITYYRRYLYCIVLDIAENDSIDCGNATSNSPKANRNVAKAELTNTDAPASELQVNSLKNALKKLKEKDDKYTEWIKTIALKTKKFTEITKQECEELIIKIGGILNDSNNVEQQESRTNNSNSETKEDNRD